MKENNFVLVQLPNYICFTSNSQPSISHQHTIEIVDIVENSASLSLNSIPIEFIDDKFQSGSQFICSIPETEV